MAEVGIPGKKEWPELLGTDGEKAVTIIKCENPNVKECRTILEGTGIPEIFILDRVLVWVNKEGKVVQIPKVG